MKQTLLSVVISFQCLWTVRISNMSLCFLSSNYSTVFQFNRGWYTMACMFNTLYNLHYLGYKYNTLSI